MEAFFWSVVSSIVATIILAPLLGQRIDFREGWRAYRRLLIAGRGCLFLIVGFVMLAFPILWSIAVFSDDFEWSSKSILVTPFALFGFPYLGYTMVRDGARDLRGGP